MADTCVQWFDSMRALQAALGVAPEQRAYLCMITEFSSDHEATNTGVRTGAVTRLNTLRRAEVTAMAVSEARVAGAGNAWRRRSAAHEDAEFLGCSVHLANLVSAAFSRALRAWENDRRPAMPVLHKQSKTEAFAYRMARLFYQVLIRSNPRYRAHASHQLSDRRRARVQLSRFFTRELAAGRFLTEWSVVTDYFIHYCYTLTPAESQLEKFMRQWSDYLQSTFLAMDFLVREFVLPFGASACMHTLEEHEQWQREQRALHERCSRDAAARQRWFRDAAGRHDQRCAQLLAEQRYRRQELDGKQPARRSDHEAALQCDVAAVPFRSRLDGPDEAEDSVLRLMHDAIVAVGDKHRPGVQERADREPAASGLAPQNNRQEGDFSMMKARLVLNGDTRAPLLAAALRVKHGRHSLQNNALSAELRDELPRLARTVVASWPTRRQKHATVRAAADDKEAAAEVRYKKREARQARGRVGLPAPAADDSMAEKKEEASSSSSSSSSDEEDEGELAAIARAGVADADTGGSDGAAAAAAATTTTMATALQRR